MCSHEEIALAPDGPVPLEVLEREIVQLTSAIHAATCRWLGLVGEYDAREGWAQWNCRSCAHWVSWQLRDRSRHRRASRCGSRGGCASCRRSGRRTPSGELSYSKVRALTRVENVEREDELLELARHATAAQLERLVRAHRRVAAAERVAAGGPPERWLEFEHDDDGCVLVRGRLRAEEGALVMAALEAARERLVRRTFPRERPRSGERARQTFPRERRTGGTTRCLAFPRERPRPPSERRVRTRCSTIADAFLAGGQGSRAGGDRYQVVLHVDTATLEGDAGERCELGDGSPVAADTARRLACDASLVGCSSATACRCSSVARRG